MNDFQLQRWHQLCICSLIDFVVLDEKMDFHFIVGLHITVQPSGSVTEFVYTKKFAVGSKHCRNASGQHATLFSCDNAGHRQCMAQHNVSVQYDQLTLEQWKRCGGRCSGACVCSTGEWSRPPQLWQCGVHQAEPLMHGSGLSDSHQTVSPAVT